MASISSRVVMRQYYLRCSLILVCYLAVIFPCICLYSNVWSIMFCTALYLPVKLLIRIVANKTIACVLFTNLDAIEFQKIIQQKGFLPPLDYRINAAMFTGDYKTAVNIATSQIKKGNSIRAKYLYLCILAQAYFELRDFEKLQKILMEYDNYRAKHSSKSFLSQSYSVWSYYRYFLEHNYQACKILCKERNLGIRPNSWDAKLIRLKNDFFYAVACYENKEFEEAERIFKSVVSYAPKMHLSVVAEKYLAAIAQNSQCPFVATQVVPDPNFQIHNSKAINKIKRNRLIIIITSIIVVFLVIVGSVFDFFGEKENKELEAYETQLCAALLEQYQKYNLIDYFNFYYNNEITDVFAIVEDENGRCDIGFVVTSDAGGTFDFEIAVDDIEYGKSYVIDSTTGTHSVIIDVGVKSEKKYDEIIKLKLEDLETAIGFEYLGN